MTVPWMRVLVAGSFGLIVPIALMVAQLIRPTVLEDYILSAIVSLWPAWVLYASHYDSLSFVTIAASLGVNVLLYAFVFYIWIRSRIIGRSLLIFFFLGFATFVFSFL